MWPPLAAEVTDIVRATVLFDCPYELACFSAYLVNTWDVVKVKNYFRQAAASGVAAVQIVPRIHSTCAVYLGDTRCIVEVQLHLRTTYVNAKSTERNI